VHATLAELLGYLNFSSGSSDPKALRNLSDLFGAILCEGERRPAATLRRWLEAELAALHAQGGAFADIQQAAATIGLVFDEVLPAYREFHRDLLFHQSEADLEQPFFLGRVMEAVLAQGAPWDQTERIVSGALKQLNDYVGYRPVAVLESGQKMEPYEHERVRPIPLYIAGAGVAAGPYAELMERCLEILRAADSELLEQAWFDLDLVDELALDPRCYDFDHPVNKRPNHHFGQWDPYQLDNQGRYRRFILQQVTLEALLARVDDASGEASRDELLLEAAAVLAGTILMASGTCGAGPHTHDSGTTLSSLLPHIARYRDGFYEALIAQMQGEHAERLRAEAAQLHQPFGGARQHLNHELARRRATQLQHVHLAQLFARMGYPDAAMQQVRTVQVASARMLCEIYCRLAVAHREIDAQQLESVPGYLREVEELLRRAVECGAVVDPWNVVGFGGNFSLFPALENSIRDYRVDTLIELVEQIFLLCARAWSEAAAQDRSALEEAFSAKFEQLAQWWDPYATATVSGVKHVVGKQLMVSTNLVAGALNAWHKAGAAAGDIGFWRMFVDQFDSPKAFQLVVEALLEKGDLVASMALLMQWLSQAPRIKLQEGDSSLHRLAMRWLATAEQQSLAPGENAPGDRESGFDDRWPLVRKWFDFLEANAEHYWQVPQLEISGNKEFRPGSDADNPDWPADEEDLVDSLEFDAADVPAEEDDEDLFSAAYDEVTFRDSASDGFEGATLEGGGTPAEEDALEQECERLVPHLKFLKTLARMWKQSACVWGKDSPEGERAEAFAAWHAQAMSNYQQLTRLLREVHQLTLPRPLGDHDSMYLYDRRRMVKESLLERIVVACVETHDAADFLLAAAGDTASDVVPRAHVRLVRSILASDPEQIEIAWPEFVEQLKKRPILYVPLSREGHPAEMAAARATQQRLRDVLSVLPRLGLIQSTCELLELAQTMEAEQSISHGAVTEFDRLFETGYKSIVESIVASADAWEPAALAKESIPQGVDGRLVQCLQQLNETQLRSWLRHSRTLRLSVVEKLSGEKDWQRFQEFVERYGSDIFTQRFLNLANVRAILHQGVEQWLSQLEEHDQQEAPWRLLEDLDEVLPRETAVRHLTVAMEAVVENYGEYRDYNSTTTQSDRGELFYTWVDFLRLRAEYDRIAWNLRPIVLAHEIIVRRGRSEAAELWRRALAERTSEAADRHLQRLDQLCRKYGMRLPTITDRIRERFIRPLLIDRVRALVQPAVEQANRPEAKAAFELLQSEAAELARDPVGAGYDMPAWLVALEEEVSKVCRRQQRGDSYDPIQPDVRHVHQSLEEILAQLDAVDGTT